MEAVWSGAWWFAITIRPLRLPNPKTGKIPGGVESIRETVAEPGARKLTFEEENRVLAGFGLSYDFWEKRLGNRYRTVSLTPPAALEKLAESNQ